LNGATKRGAYLALLFHEKPRFIAMPLGGTPFAISQCMHYGVAYLWLATLYRKLKVKHTRGKDRFPQRDDLPISNNDYRQ
ncbi:hypothetical protein T4C_8687, partial [Trichinella pseudospiralis]